MEIGSVVQLKSGGPAMTVTNVSNDGNVVDCLWFSDARLESGNFPEATLSSSEAPLGDVGDEYRALFVTYKRELKEQAHRNGQLRVEIDDFVRVLDETRKHAVTLEIERDRALHQAQTAERRCKELEEALRKTR